MKNSLWTTITLRHTALAAFAAASIVIGSASAQAQEETTFAAPLDLGWSTYADFIEIPEFLPNAPKPLSFAGRETTGAGDAPATSGGDETTATDENDPYPDSIWKFAP